MDGLAVDTVTNKIFYSDTGRDVIATANIDGSNEQIIISDGLDQPRAVVLDTANRCAEK